MATKNKKPNPMCSHAPIGGGEWWRTMVTKRKPSAKVYDRKKQPKHVEGV